MAARNPEDYNNTYGETCGVKRDYKWAVDKTVFKEKPEYGVVVENKPKAQDYNKQTEGRDPLGQRLLDTEQKKDDYEVLPTYGLLEAKALENLPQVKFSTYGYASERYYVIVDTFNNRVLYTDPTSHISSQRLKFKAALEELYKQNPDRNDIFAFRISKVAKIKKKLTVTV